VFYFPGKIILFKLKIIIKVYFKIQITKKKSASRKDIERYWVAFGGKS
jgi:hypothetical protein